MVADVVGHGVTPHSDFGVCAIIQQASGGVPRRTQSVPRPAVGGAMLTLLRLPFQPVSGLANCVRFAPADTPSLFLDSMGLRP